jgi:DNA-binding NarL/FixJ family response regulator
MRAPTPSVILRRVGPRYLIVDDSSAFLAAARTLLERQGLSVVGVATNVSECLRCVDRLDPDVILMDIDLEHDSGFELARRLARRGIRAEVIFISTHVADDFADLIATSRAAGFLSKSDLSAAAIERMLITSPGSTAVGKTSANGTRGT